MAQVLADYSPITPPLEKLLRHFVTLMGPQGLYQHAQGRVPLLKEGYCTDDNARAVLVLERLQARAETKQQRRLVSQLLAKCWQFLAEARRAPASYYNFRSAQGQWLPHDISDDMYARLVRALSAVLRHDTDMVRKRQAVAWLTELLEVFDRLTASRAWAELVIALGELPSELRDTYHAKEFAGKNNERLRRSWQAVASPDWPWFEASMTYANAVLPHSLVSAQVLSVPPDENISRQSSQFLIETTIQDGIFKPIGNKGWYQKGGIPARDDQQPIEAGTMFDFLLAYDGLFPNSLSQETVAAPYLWFFGKNSVRGVFVNQDDASCYNGTWGAEINPNCGAESMLAYLWAQVRFQDAPTAIRKYILEERQKLAAAEKN